MNDCDYSRRNFIKFTGLAIGALLMAPMAALPSSVSGQFSAQADMWGKRYLGTRNGLVFESTDDGQTWQQVANFGSHCAVLALSEQRDRLQAEGRCRWLWIYADFCQCAEVVHGMITRLTFTGGSHGRTVFVGNPHHVVWFPTERVGVV